MSNLPNIREHAILAVISISQWTARKLDKRASGDVNRSNGAKPDVARVHKRLLAKNALAKVAQIVDQARRDHDSLTLPWGIRGVSILAVPAYLDYRNRMAAHKLAFGEAVRDFCWNYEAVRDSAQAELAGLFNFDDYPSPDRIAQRFGFDVQFLPVPESNDFRVKLPGIEMEQVKADLENEHKRALNEAVREVYSRAIGPLETMADRLAAYVPSQGKGSKAENVFRDSLVLNVREMAAALPKLNIFGDSDLADLAERMNAIASAEPKDLRDSDALRSDTVKQAREAIAAIQASAASYL